MMIQSRFYMALGCIVAGVIVAMFPSNYEIVGMEGVEIDSGDEENND
jgi:hypothetical protein